MDEQLKARVVGAAVLVLVAAVFIPMILSGPESTDGPVPAATPTGEGRDSPPAVVLRPEHTLTLAPGEESDTYVAPAPPLASPTSRSAPAAEASVTPAHLGAAEVSKSAAGWVVQLGSFSNARNARELKKRLVKKGFSAFLVTSSGSGVEITRVLVGPEKTRDDARARLPGLYQETKLKGIVTRYDG